jgi:hypothetical protein
MYYSPEERTIERQAQIIAKNNDEFRILHERVNQLELDKAGLEPRAHMYDKIVKMVTENPSLQVIWDELVTTMKLIDEDDTFAKRRGQWV